MPFFVLFSESIVTCGSGFHNRKLLLDLCFPLILNAQEKVNPAKKILSILPELMNLIILSVNAMSISKYQ
jgi:hypothetical protein